MDAPPLTLSILRLSPSTLLLDPIDDPLPPTPLPPTPVTRSLPTPTFSPTPSYPQPYPTCILGSTISLGLALANTSRGSVMGVKMMCEVQTPGGRYRLGEIIHGVNDVDDEEGKAAVEGGSAGVDLLPELGTGEEVKMEVETECKELGVCVVIVSVAWETLDGRRTFQRFFKFNVVPPLAIKTRIHSSQHPNTALDPIKREWVYLEVLAQNVSNQGMLFDKVILEPVHGLNCRIVDSNHTADQQSQRLESSTETITTRSATNNALAETLMPGDTRQYLFVLSPTAPSSAELPEEESNTPQSSFPPIHTPGMILPLGRLDLAWRAGDAHDKGRLQTSTLNRRIPVAPIASSSSAGTGLAPTRTTSAMSPAPMARMGSTNSVSVSGPSGTPGTPRTPGRTLRQDGEEGGGDWEWDLVVVKAEREGVEVESEFEVVVRVGARTAPTLPRNDDRAEEGNGDEEGSKDDVSQLPPPPVPIIGVQYLSQPLTSIQATTSTSSVAATNVTGAGPSVSVLPPSRSNTPLTRPGSTTSLSSRPFSPLSSVRQQTISRPMTPVSSQLRQATSSHIGSPFQSASAHGSPLLPPVSLPPLSGPFSSSAFPPPPTPSLPTKAPPLPPLTAPFAQPHPQLDIELRGQVQNLGCSLIVLPRGELAIKRDRLDTTYVDPLVPPPRRWELTQEVTLRFVALQEGLAELGGLRILLLHDEMVGSGSVAKEWDSLGVVWVSEGEWDELAG